MGEPLPTRLGRPAVEGGQAAAKVSLSKDQRVEQEIRAHFK